MKRFLSSVGFCLFLLFVGFFAFLPSSNAEQDLIGQMLELPAPPPPNPFYKPVRRYRDPDFYSSAKVPDDEAPIEDLMDYWARQNQIDRGRGYAQKVSDKSLERIMKEIEEDPERLLQYVNLFAGNKDAIEFAKNIYDAELIARKYTKDWRESLKTWLTFNSPYFSNELVDVARTVRDEAEYVTNQDELLALAKVDWDKAEPILNRLENNSSQPVSQTLARWAYYQHALDNKDTFEADKWRELLKKTVEDKSALPGTRDLAMDALVRGGDFEGRDEWYMTLLGDETLHDLRINGRSYTGLTTIINFAPAGKYTERMIELLRSNDKAVRSAAIRNLANAGSLNNEEALRLMLPWLDDPKWATDINGSRRAMIGGLKNFVMPEAVPGLLAALADRERYKKTAPSSANTAANTVGVDYINVYEYRTYVGDIVAALGKQRDPRAAPELRAVLPEFESWQRQQVVRAIIDCNGFSTYEQIDGLEFVARNNAERQEVIRRNANLAANVVRTDGDLDPVLDEVPIANRAIYAANSASVVASRPGVVEPNELKALIGAALYRYDDPPEDLVTQLASRIDALAVKEPLVAENMRAVFREWGGTAVNALLMRSVKNGTGSIEDALKVLSRRAEIREKQINDIFDMRGGNAFAVGFSACLLEQNSEYDAILDGDNNEIKAATLACARLIRAKLPVPNVAKFLNSADKNLAKAAELYLESEDSVEARTLVLAQHPNEAKVLGARVAFGDSVIDESMREVFVSVDPDSGSVYFGADFDDLDKVEKSIREELISNPDLLGVYSYQRNFVKIFKDKIIYSWEEDPARFRERAIDKNELERIKAHLADSRVDELTPFLAFCGEYCGESRELLMMSRAGGRRVFQMGFEVPPFFEKLDTIFSDMRRAPAKLSYYMQKGVPGLEIIYEDENLDAVTVWKEGPDLRVLTDNAIKREQIEADLEAQDKIDADSDDLDYGEAQERRRQRRQARAFENLQWFRFGNGRPIAPAEQPTGFSFIPVRDRAAVQPDTGQWRAKNAALEIRADSDGLYKIVRGQMSKIKPGFYESPILTPNGRWAIAKRYGDDESEESYAPSVVRVNLATGKEFRVKYDNYPPIQPIVYVPAQGKVLIGAGYDYSDYGEFEDEEFRMPTMNWTRYFWLDPETGVFTSAKGNIAPLAQQTFRGLQPVAGKPDEFWTAIPDEDDNKTEIGTYNARTMTFKAVMSLPKIEFTSMNMWVDETEVKVYFAYSGHLLSAPLK